MVTFFFRGGETTRVLQIFSILSATGSRGDFLPGIVYRSDFCRRSKISTVPKFSSTHKKRTSDPRPPAPKTSPQPQRATARRSAGNAPARQAAAKTEGNGTASPQQQRRNPNARQSQAKATDRRAPQGQGRPTARHGRTSDARREQKGDNGQATPAHHAEDRSQTATQQRGQRDHSRRKAATSATKAEAHTPNTPKKRKDPTANPAKTAARGTQPPAPSAQGTTPPAGVADFFLVTLGCDNTASTRIAATGR